MRKTITCDSIGVRFILVISVFVPNCQVRDGEWTYGLDSACVFGKDITKPA